MNPNFTFDRIEDRISNHGIEPIVVARKMAKLDSQIRATRDPFVLVSAIVFDIKREHWGNGMEQLYEKIMEDFPVSSQPTLTRTANEIEYNECLFDYSEHGKGKHNNFQKNQIFIRMLVESCDNTNWDSFKRMVMDEKTLQPAMKHDLQ